MDSNKLCRKCKATVLVTEAEKKRRLCCPCKAAYTREWRKTNPNVREQERAKHAARYKTPEERYKRRARAMVQRAIAGGKLVPQPCEVCGTKAEAHHDDYTKPLDVRWFCPHHHRQHHLQEAA